MRYLTRRETSIAAQSSRLSRAISNRICAVAYSTRPERKSIAFELKSLSPGERRSLFSPSAGEINYALAPCLRRVSKGSLDQREREREERTGETRLPFLADASRRGASRCTCMYARRRVCIQQHRLSRAVVYIPLSPRAGETEAECASGEKSGPAV